MPTINSSDIFDMIYQYRVVYQLGDVFHEHDDIEECVGFTFVIAPHMQRHIYFFYADGMIKVQTALFGSTLADIQHFSMKNWYIAINIWCGADKTLPPAQLTTRPNMTFEWSY